MKTIEKIKLIFFEALEKETEDEREAYLNEACRDDPSLRAEIDALLKGHFRTEVFHTKKLQRIPAQMAEPITPDELQAMACIRR